MGLLDMIDALKVFFSKLGEKLSGPARPVSVLIAEDDYALSTLLERALTSMAFKVTCSATVGHALPVLGNHDILISDLALLNGHADLLLNQWVASGSAAKPICVITASSFNHELYEKLITCGAWNVLFKPFEIGVLQMIVSRYAQIVNHTRLASEVKRLRRAVLALTILVLILTGKEFLPWILDLVIPLM